MKAETKVKVGFGVIFFGVIQFIAIALLLSNKPELRFVSPVSSGIVGGCVAAGVGLIQRGRDPQKDKQARIESQDERNQLIKGKAAYITFFVMLFMLLVFANYLLHVVENEFAGWICYGIIVCGGIVYGIAHKLYGRKL